jgi:CRP-like cAMP-binding protein
VRLLEAEPDLGRWLSPADFENARARAVLPVTDLDEGTWHARILTQDEGVRGHVHGFLVVSGVLAQNVRLLDRTSIRVIAPGDIALLDGLENDSIPTHWTWSTLAPSQLAILDQRLLLFGRRWPALLSAIMARAGEQTRHAQIQHAISNQPRVEDRLILLFWTLGDRIGVVRSEGLSVPVQLKHETIAQMIGARRPTVSLALSSLAERGLVYRTTEGWLVDRRSLDQTGIPKPTAVSVETARAELDGRA